MKFTDYAEERTDEVVSPNNIGFEEMAKFYQKATPQQIKEMERMFKNENWDKFKSLIYKVLGVKLK